MRKSSLNMKTAIYLAAVCGQTYNSYHTLLVPYGYQLIGFFEASSYWSDELPFGFFLESDEAIILAFRGTSTATDWVTDLLAEQIPFRFVKKSGLTHRGFTEIYMSIRDRIFDLLDQLPASKTLFITGHSLGGALATLATMDITANRSHDQVITYTFAAPRVGDPTFVKTYNAAVTNGYRIQNEYDIVPRLPPLVYKSPRTDKVYYYMHVKEEVKRSFRNGSIGGNHIISSYFADLSRESPAFADQVCSFPPGWCPNIQ